MIVGLSGYAQSGKDTVAEYLIDNYGFVRVAFADPIRDALYALDPLVRGTMTVQPIVNLYGWEEAKQNFPEIRRMLQRFGTEVGRTLWSENFWVEQAFAKIKQYENVVVTDVRFTNEADAISSLPDGKMWRVVRNDVGPVNRHPSETQLDRYLFDEIISNNSTKKSLYKIINSLV